MDAAKADILAEVERFHQQHGDTEWLGVADLRDLLGEKHNRKDVDEAIRRLIMGQDSPMRGIPAANRKALTARDREAAVPMVEAGPGGDLADVVNAVKLKPRNQPEEVLDTPSAERPKGSKRTTRVTLPDGTVATRTSQSRSYTHAVVVTRNNRAQASGIRAEIDRRERFIEALQQWIADGADRSELKAYPTGSLSYNDVKAGISPNRYYLPGFEPVRSGGRGGWSDKYQFSLPNFSDKRPIGYKDGKTAWEVYGPGYVMGQQREQIARDRRRAAELDAGPAESHYVSRWSSSRTLAERGRDEVRSPYTTTRVVEVD